MVTATDIGYQPHAMQEKFHESAAKVRICVAGTRGGKSRALTVECALAMQFRPGSVGLICSPDYPMFRRNLKSYLDELLLPMGSFSARDYCYRHKNGSVAWIVYAENADKLRGVGADWVAGDELRMWPREAWQIVTIRADKPWSRMWGVTTPNGKDWVYDDLMTTAGKAVTLDGTTANPDGDVDTEVFSWKTLDNTKAPDLRPVVARAQRILPPQFFRQEYECSIEEFTGLVYPDFRPAEHVAPAPTLPPDWPRLIGLDFGAADPTAIGAWAVDEKGDVWKYDEWAEAGQPLRTHAEVVKRMMGDAHDVTIRAGADAKQEILELENLLSVKIQAAPLDFIARYSRITELLRDGRLHVDPHCEQTIRAYERYRWPMKTSAGASRDLKPMHAFSDIPDSDGYALTADITAPTRATPRPSRWSWGRIREDIRKFRRGGEGWRVPSLQPNW